MEKNEIKIKLPKTLKNFLEERADLIKISIDELITNMLDQFCYEYEDNYPYWEVKEEIKNDKPKK